MSKFVEAKERLLSLARAAHSSPTGNVTEYSNECRRLVSESPDLAAYLLMEFVDEFLENQP